MHGVTMKIEILCRAQDVCFSFHYKSVCNNFVRFMFNNLTSKCLQVPAKVFMNNGRYFCPNLAKTAILIFADKLRQLKISAVSKLINTAVADLQFLYADRKMWRK